MDLRRKRKILLASVWVIGALVILGTVWKMSWLTAMAVAAMAGWLVLAFLWWRCPHCGMGLGRLDKKTRCPYCDSALYEEDL